MNKWLAMATSTFVWLGSVPCLADRPLAAWGDLVERADLVVLGVVTDVKNRSDGSQIAAILIEEDYTRRAKSPEKDKPKLPTSVLALGDTVDPSAAMFAEGERVVALLAVPTGPQVGAPHQKVFRPVGARQGVMEVPDRDLEATRQWLRAMADANHRVDLALMEPLLRRNEPLPQRVLFGSCLVELSDQAADPRPTKNAAGERERLRQMACSAPGVYWARARQWAFEEAGRQRLDDTGSCLEAVASNELEEVDDRLAAARGLGSLADASHVPALLELMTASSAPGDDEDPVDDALAEAATLALGQTGAPSAIPSLRDAALSGDFEVASTAIHSLGLVGGREAIRALRQIAQETSDPNLRRQARDSIQQLRQAE